MSYVFTAPDMLANAAGNVADIGSAISTASANAAVPTTALLPAAEDEVSAAIAKLFGAYGEEYQALVAQAEAFHAQFTQNLAAAGSAYTEAEAGNAALMEAASNAQSAPTVPSGLTSPFQSLVGPTSAGTGASGGIVALKSVPTSADPLVALIMGGTFNPTPDPGYVTNVFNSYIQPSFPGATPQGVFTPEQFWPVSPNLGNLTFGQSVSQGVTLLDDALQGPTGVLTQGNSAVVFGYSQSATIATNEIRALMAAGSPYQGQLSFVMIGDPNNPVGGILERFPGF